MGVARCVERLGGLGVGAYVGAEGPYGGEMGCIAYMGPGARIEVP